MGLTRLQWILHCFRHLVIELATAALQLHNLRHRWDVINGIPRFGRTERNAKYSVKVLNWLQSTALSTPCLFNSSEWISQSEMERWKYSEHMRSMWLNTYLGWDCVKVNDENIWNILHLQQSDMSWCWVRKKYEIYL